MCIRDRGEVDLDPLLGDRAGRVGVGREDNVVDEAEVDDVDGEFGVVDIAEGLADFFFSEGHVTVGSWLSLIHI